MIIEITFLMGALIAFISGVSIAWWHLTMLRRHMRKLGLHPCSRRALTLSSLARFVSLLLVFYLFGRYLEGVQMLLLLCGFIIGRFALTERFAATVPMR